MKRKFWCPERLKSSLYNLSFVTGQHTERGAGPGAVAKALVATGGPGQGLGQAATNTGGQAQLPLPRQGVGILASRAAFKPRAQLSTPEGQSIRPQLPPSWVPGAPGGHHTRTRGELRAPASGLSLDPVSSVTKPRAVWTQPGHPGALPLGREGEALRPRSQVSGEKACNKIGRAHV